MTGIANIPNLAGYEIRPGVTLIGEPTAVPGSNKLRCLANAFGALVLVELKINFVAPESTKEGKL